MSIRSATGRLAGALVGGLLLCTVSMANASVIMLSGDTNITDNLLTNTSNQNFFSNLLQGGTNVVVHDAALTSEVSDVNAFYNGLGGVSSTLLGANAVLGAPTLAAADLYVAAIPVDAYTAAEATVLSNFVLGGGSIFFMGDNAVFETENGHINAILSDLGSGMSIDNSPFFDIGFQLAVGGQIAVDPFTVGVTSLSYAAPSAISGGTQIVFGTGAEPFIAYEGAIVSVPEPGTLVLFGLGLAGVGFVRRRKRLPNSWLLS